MSDGFRVTVSGGQIEERSALASCIASALSSRGFRDVGVVGKDNRRTPISVHEDVHKTLRDQIARSYPKLFERKLTVVVIPLTEEEQIERRVEQNTLNQEIRSRERMRSLDQQEELLEDVSER